jgi:hypothetical protein
MMEIVAVGLWAFVAGFGLRDMLPQRKRPREVIGDQIVEATAGIVSQQRFVGEGDDFSITAVSSIQTVNGEFEIRVTRKRGVTIEGSRA